MKMREVIGIIR